VKARLRAAELDAHAGLDRWLAQRRDDLEILAERGTYLDRGDVHRLLDLSLPGADELVGLLELLRLAREEPCDEVIVDTAPTGHTLRLLAMPGELRRLATALDRMQSRHRIVAETLGGAWHPDRSDALIDEIEEQGEEIQTLLRDPERTAFHWVLLPEEMALAETRDGVRALEAAGLHVPELIVNQVTPAGPSCPLCDARREAEEKVIAEVKRAFPGKVVRLVPCHPEARNELKDLGGRTSPPPRSFRLVPRPQDDVQGRFDGFHLLFFGGKGGVGKTTCAIAAALLQAKRRPADRILLLSTDPAHSLADGLGVELGDDERPVPGAPANLRVRELDAVRTLAEWRARHLDGLEEWRDVLDLTPPGLDELSAVSAILDALAAYDLVIVDTAPTGHTLQLLETPASMLSWVQALLSLMLKYREVTGLGTLAEELLELLRGLRRLGETLRDPSQTAFVTVTRAAELPRRETVRLLDALDRLGINVPAIVVDAVIPSGCPRCNRERTVQEEEIESLRDLGRAIIEAPAVFPPPRGVRALAAWGRTWESRQPLPLGRA
jgi:arsenite-transporting ATPase